MPTPVPIPGIWVDAFKVALDWGLLDPPDGVKVEAVPYDEWEQHFDAPRRRQLAAARDQEVNLRRVVRHTRKVLVKRELLPKWFPGAELDFKPRIVLESELAYQRATGPWCYAMSHALEQMWSPALAPGRQAHFTYAAGMTLEGLSEWIWASMQMYTHCLFVSLDETCWDGTLPPEALGVEVDVYERMGCPASVLSLIRKQGVLSGRTDHGAYFKRQGARATGVNNTSCGNSLLDGMAVALWLSVAKVPPVQVSVLVMGDDVLLITDARYEPALKESARVFKFMGLINKAHYSTDPFDLEFCSKVPYPVEGVPPLMMGPKIGRIIAKTGFCKQDWKPSKLRAWLRGVAVGLDRDVSHIPILRVLVREALIQTQGEAPLIEYRERYKIHAVDYHLMSERVYNVLEERYGVCWDEVRDLELKLAGRRMPFIVHSSVLERIMARDCPSPQQERDPLCDWLAVVARLWSIVGAPLVEEAVKRKAPIFGAVACCLEAVANWWSGSSPEAVALALLAHSVWARLDYCVAVALHALYNWSS